MEPSPGRRLKCTAAPGEAGVIPGSETRGVWERQYGEVEDHRIGGNQIRRALKSLQRGAEGLQIVGEAYVPGRVGGVIGFA